MLHKQPPNLHRRKLPPTIHHLVLRHEGKSLPIDLSANHALRVSDTSVMAIESPILNQCIGESIHTAMHEYLRFPR